MAWDIDHICWHLIRDKILKDRYAGVHYSMLNSFSPVIVKHRKPLPMKDRKKVWKLFPKWIRVEFQEVYYEGERVTLEGRGDLIRGPVGTYDYPMNAREFSKYLEDQPRPVVVQKYEKDEKGKWNPVIEN